MAEINEQLIADMVRQVMRGMTQGASPTAPSSAAKSDSGCCRVSSEDYPLGVKRPELVKSPTGKRVDDLTLEAVMKGDVTFKDFSITPDALELQAQVAESAGRSQIGLNLRRAAELTRIPDERILEMYNALRPHRSTYEELIGIAEELEGKYQAKSCAYHVREAADVYRRRKLLKGDLPEA